MNGKNRRVRGCASRGAGYIRLLKRKSTVKPSYNLHKFSKYLKDNLIHDSQKNLLNELENYAYRPKYEEYSFSSNSYRSIISLRQNHFNTGTVRITIPGIYILKENIVFNPNENNDFQPTENQQENQYCCYRRGPYHLGFFSAITIETLGVILDLNGFTIKQSKLHNLQQRFYANIELGSSPFISGQGPAEFTNDADEDSKLHYKAPNSICILNGTLGLSSHHGIHGNTMQHVVIENLNITNFEVAGIALNGGRNCILNNININNVSQNIKILSTYSQSRFIRTFLERSQNSNTHLIINGVNKSSVDITNELNTELEVVKSAIMSNSDFESKLFKNTTRLYDGNVYGLLLNQNGVAVHKFLESRDSTKGNEFIHLQDIKISNIISHPIEIIGLSIKNSGESSSYGTKRQAGPIGDILDISNIIQSSTGKYLPNVLSNAQILIGKNNNPKQGTTSITEEVVNWVENESNINTDPSFNCIYFINRGDSMGHTMKGNLGLFLSGAENITAQTITISNVLNRGFDVNTSPLITDISKNSISGRNLTDNSAEPWYEETLIPQGNDSVGILETASGDNINLLNVTISNIQSENGFTREHHRLNII